MDALATPGGSTVIADGARMKPNALVLCCILVADIEISTVIDTAFRVALARSVAVHLTIETHYFWEHRPDLWNYFDADSAGYDPANVANVEWSDWSRTPNKMRYIDWGAPQGLGAPHMCYLAPRVQAEVARLGGVS